ncbi:NAD(P)H-dependent flavin oxidoreductase [Alicyclobacillus fastidiosus]|uniref:Probable nitronate monooxygenase n=1 Tax=Alicyclobacillus fastidiosus TaxID=392011 RepID=A0ABV5A9G6_9BACL|nr:nitronate monooxygenase family protein [Alicyclobacillus fastidiosus]WEH10845.1 nitronate monooxygenase family protein [Alicyclobacillus fastidiosus]
MLNNSLTRILQIRYPIIQGGLAYVANGKLAAAVSNAGGLGQVGAAGRTPEAFREQIRVAKSLTDQPFGVNIPVSRHTDNSPYVQVALEEAANIVSVSLSAGDPRPFVPSLKAAGLKVLLVVATVRQAVRAQEVGADVLICEGFEAGGHDSPLENTVFTLVPQVVQIAEVPVVAAGGVASGRQVAAAFMLGAEGVQMGTRFVATAECEAHPRYKDLLVQAGDDGTVVLERTLGVSTRVLKNDYAAAALDVERADPSGLKLRPLMTGERNRLAAIDGRTDEGYLYAGQSVGLISSVVPAGEAIEQIVEETRRALGNTSQYQAWL